MAPRLRKLSMAILAGGMVAGSPLIAACSSIPFVGGNEEYEAWKATDGASGRINLQDVEMAFKATRNFGAARDFEIRVNRIYEGDGLVMFRAAQTDSVDGERLTLEGWEDLNASFSVDEEHDERLFSIVKEKDEYEIQGYHANGYYNSRFGLGEPQSPAIQVCRAYRSEDGNKVIIEIWIDKNRDGVIDENSDTLSVRAASPVGEPLPPRFVAGTHRLNGEDLLFAWLKLTGAGRGAYFYQSRSKTVGSNRSVTSVGESAQKKRNREYAAKQQALVGPRYREAGLNISAARQTYQKGVKSTGSFEKKGADRYAAVSCELYERRCPRERSAYESDDGGFFGGGGQVRFRDKRRGRRGSTSSPRTVW